jgi:hypothetical protein
MEKEAKAAVPVQPAVEAPAAGGRIITGGWDPDDGWDPDGSDDEYVYVAPENPYDTSIVDADEVTRVFSPSAVLPSSVCYMV